MIKKINLSVTLGLISLSSVSLADNGMVTYEEAVNKEWGNICNGEGQSPQGALKTVCDKTTHDGGVQIIKPGVFGGPGAGSNTGTSAGLANSTHLSDYQNKKAVKERLSKLKEKNENGSNMTERLGFFINGATTQTEQIETRFENGYDSELAKFTAGVDYLFTDKFLAGFTVGYSNTDLDFIGGSHTELDSVSTLFYGSYAMTDALSIDGYAGWTGGEFDIQRNFSYPDSCACDPSNPFNNHGTASASTNSDKVSAGIGASYNINMNAFSIIPKIRFDYTDTFIDGYDELGTNGLGLRYQDQEITTIQTDIGVDATYAWSLPWGVILPRIGLSYVHEFSNDSRLIHTSLISDPSQIDMAFNTNNPERDYMRTSIGISAVLPHGIQLFINYERTDFHRYFDENYTVTGGIRVGI